MKNKIECNKWIFTKLDLDEISIIKNILNNDEYVNINISKNNNDYIVKYYIDIAKKTNEESEEDVNRDLDYYIRKHNKDTEWSDPCGAYNCECQDNKNKINALIDYLSK